MKIQAFAIFDRDTGVFHTPFFAPHLALAVRMFKNVTNDPSSTLNRNPGSFDLRLVGTYDDARGTFENNDTPELIVTATGVMEPDNQTLLPFVQEKEKAS